MNRQVRAAPPEIEQSPLHRAFDDYNRMESELADIRAKNEELMIQNMNLLSEVGMLREMLERSDIDRIRLQAVSSTLLGRLLAINDAIAGAVKESVRHGIEATEQASSDTPELEQAAKEAQSIIQRLPAQDDAEMAPRPLASPRAPQAIGDGLPAVDWRRRHG